MKRIACLVVAATLWGGCGPATETRPPLDGWATQAPTVVDAVIDQGDHRLLAVTEGDRSLWVQVPPVHTQVGDYVLLGPGTPAPEIPVPEGKGRGTQVLAVRQVKVIDAQTAKTALRSSRPAEALTVEAAYAQIDQLKDQEVVVHGTAVKSTTAVGWTWVHLRDGTGNAREGTDDLTVQTTEAVVVGQRVTYRGVLRANVELGFGYRYDVLVEEGTLLR